METTNRLLVNMKRLLTHAHIQTHSVEKRSLMVMMQSYQNAGTPNQYIFNYLCAPVLSFFLFEYDAERLSTAFKSVHSTITCTAVLFQCFYVKPATSSLSWRHNTFCHFLSCYLDNLYLKNIAVPPKKRILGQN